ncbi:MAG: hypothetical protein WBY53_12745 [Acidobacteriaceae bacterium]
MGGLFFALFYLSIAYIGYRKMQRAGIWSWQVFLGVIGFLALECLIVTLPLKFAPPRSRHFVLVWTAAWIIAALNFVWFLLLCRRWKPKLHQR